MNLFATLMAGKPSKFEAALDRSGGLDALIRQLKDAEAAMRKQWEHRPDSQDRAFVLRYAEAISCARVELERLMASK
ncbi:hypothetical protein BTI_4166 [Burkholderia thailandensis MSMB121]|uniref:hypothetical protein n=1 Tax=Burkholderia humptydooensis TaxID=430531 RepID=UPI000327F071|nr:hypothetical protein [Burkholderia humptydooensis]AGK51745.1 hypothetical protein BTI_4166 [Burkholderia thailandensis MSMB121]ATF32274.1 hypothetical protein CO709_01785 [Burkholderia thailandensis]KST72340.1 hypothetical protein WS76_28110 [Burkholderia humptydooensis]